MCNRFRLQLRKHAALYALYQWPALGATQVHQAPGYSELCMEPVTATLLSNTKPADNPAAAIVIAMVQHPLECVGLGVWWRCCSEGCSGWAVTHKGCLGYHAVACCCDTGASLGQCAQQVACSLVAAKQSLRCAGGATGCIQLETSSRLTEVGPAGAP